MWLKRILISVIIVFILVLISAGLFFGSVYLGIFGPLPEKRDLIGITNEEASLVFSSDSSLLGKFFAENRTNIKWEDIPPHLVEALIATEDKRFYEHEGIDSRSYARVFFKSILLGDKSSGGGSTITQQLVKNLYGRKSHSFLSMPVSKVREAIIAARMEDVLSKQEILLLYLNSIPFGEEVYGIEAAAKRYFDKNAKQLNIQESALLIGILKANTYYNPRLHPDNAIKRRNQVITLMANAGFIDLSKADSLINLKLMLSYTNFQLESPAGYFVYQVKKRVINILEDKVKINGETYDIRKDGLNIYTTLDLRLQQLANQSSHKQLKHMQPLLDNELSRTGQRRKWEAEMQKKSGIGSKWNDRRNINIITLDGMKTDSISMADSLWYYYKMLNTAVLAVNPTSGAVLAWTGGNNFRYLPYDHVLAERQIASTFKPIIYAAAMENGFLPCDYFDNNVIEYEEYEGWKPENYDKSYSEDIRVAMWYALSRSLNLPTVDIYFNTGHENVADLGRRLDFEVPFEETPSLSLGAIDASLYDVVKAYCAFANQGYLLADLLMIEKITDSDGYIIYKNEDIEKTRVMSLEITQQITDILEIAIDEGTGIRLRNRYQISADLAGKTGTAQNYSDAWFTVYTPDIVIGTWVGARSSQMHFQSGLGSGSSLALPIAGKIIASVEQQPAMKNKYLTTFYHSEDSISIADCDPFREKGFDGFINRWMKKDTLETSTKKEREKKEYQPKQDSKFKSFFKRIFKKKNKKRN